MCQNAVVLCLKVIREYSFLHIEIHKNSKPVLMTSRFLFLFATFIKYQRATRNYQTKSEKGMKIFLLILLNVKLLKITSLSNLMLVHLIDNYFFNL